MECTAFTLVITALPQRRPQELPRAAAADFASAGAGGSQGQAV